MSNCPNCGAGIDGPGSFCPQCGAQLPQQAPPQPQAPPQTPPPQPGYPTPPPQTPPAQPGYQTPPPQPGYQTPPPQAQAQPYTPPPQQAAPESGGGYQTFDASAGAAYSAAYAPEGDPPSTTPAIILGVLTLCCCIPGGIAGIATANSAKKYVAMEEYDMARSKLKTSYVISILSIVFGLIVNVVYIALQIAAEM